MYIDDAASATVAALERGVGGGAYNITDNEPVSMPDLLTGIAAAVGAPQPWVVPAGLLRLMPYARAVMTGGLRASNAKAVSELGWTLEAPTYHEGIRLLARHYTGAAARSPVTGPGQ